jgi:hypothetical protein
MCGGCCGDYKDGFINPEASYKAVLDEQVKNAFLF